MELSPDEERHIQNLSVIPAAIVTYVFIGLFVYLVRNNSSLSFLFYVAYFGVAFLLAMPIALFLSEVMLVSRRTRRPVTSYAKKFLGKMSIFVLGGILSGTVFGIVDLTLSSSLDESVLLVLGGAMWFGVWGTLVIRFRKRLDRLSKGD